jgi:hypothetical protein
MTSAPAVIASRVLAKRSSSAPSPAISTVDVTPLHDDPKHRPISPSGDVLFLVDTYAQPIAVGSTVGPRPSRFYALDADDRLVAHVRRLQETEDEACHNLYAGGR